LRALAEQHQGEIEEAFTAILRDGVKSAEADRLWWADLQSVDVFMGSVFEVVAAAWDRAVYAFWLDKSLEDGFSADAVDGEDG